MSKFIPSHRENDWIKIFPCGHLSFVKNEDPYKEAFRLVNNYGQVTWQKASSIPDSCYLDKHGGFSPLFKSLQYIDYY